MKELDDVEQDDLAVARFWQAPRRREEPFMLVRQIGGHEDLLEHASILSQIQLDYS